MAVRKKRRSRRPHRLAALGLAVLFAAGAGAGWFLLGRHDQPGEGVKLPDYVEQEFLSINSWSRPGTPLKKIDGVVIHYVGNPGTTAEANRNYFQSLALGTDKIYASAHFIVGLQGEVIQCIPLTEISYASNSRNDDTVSIEVCHPDESGQFSDQSYNRAVELTAWLCHTFDLTADDVIRHYDITGKDCPKYYVENPEAWEGFRTDVSKALADLNTGQ